MRTITGKCAGSRRVGYDRAVSAQQQHGPAGADEDRGGRRHVRWPMRLLVFLIMVALAFAAGVGYLYRYQNDEYLARTITRAANESLRGRLEFGSLHWSPEALVEMAMGVPSRVVVEEFAAYDSQGNRVVHAPRAEGKVDLYRLLLGGGDVIISGLEVTGAEVVVAQVPSGRPGETMVGIADAFMAREPSPDDDSSFRLELNDFDVKQTRLRLAFGPWSLELEGINTRGDFRLPGSDVAATGMVIRQTSRVARGVMKVGERQLKVGQIRLQHVPGLPPTDLGIHLDTTVAGSAVKVRGTLADLYGPKRRFALRTDVGGAQHIVRAFAGGLISERAPIEVAARIDERMEAPVITALARGGALDLDDPFAARLERARVTFRVGELVLLARDVAATAAGGKATAAGRLDLAAGTWNGHVKLRGGDLSSVSPELAGELSGNVALKGGLRSVDRGLAVASLRLRRTPRKGRDWLPREITASGTVHLGPRVLDLAGVKIQGGSIALEARGSVNVATRQVNLYTRLKAPRLQRWLARRRLPAVARSVSSDVHVTGRFPDLRADGKLTARGVGYGALRLPELTAAVTFSGGALSLERIRSAGYGGKINGRARLDLFAGSLLRPRRRPIVQARVKAAGLDLTALGASPYAIGRVFADAKVSGPLDDIKGEVTLRAPRVTLQGDRYEDSRIRLGLLRDRVSIFEGLLRRAGGGTVRMWGDVYFDRRLDLRVTVAGFPVQGIPQASVAGLGLGGTIDGKLTVGGSFDDPRPAGAVRVRGARLRGVLLGAGKLELTPGSDAIQLSGRFFGKMLRLSGYFFTRPTPRLNLTLQVEQVPLEKLIYELRQIGDVRGRISGRVRLALDGAKGLTWADARFPRLRLQLRYRPPGRRQLQRVTLSNRAGQDVLARYDGRQLHVVTAKLVSRLAGRETARFSIGGWIADNRADMRLRGKVALEVLEFFLERKVKSLDGSATTDMRLTGPLDDLKLKGDLWLERIRIQMPKFERAIRISKAHVRLVPGLLQLQGLRVRVGRELMRASGKLELRGFRPTLADLQLNGNFNAKLLELLFPEKISGAAGRAGVSLKITGPLRDPQLKGVVTVKRVEVSPRGWGRTLTLTKGRVSFSNFLVKVLSPLEGTYDEGLMRVTGEVRLDRWDLVDIYLKIVGTGIPQRQPKVYSAEVNLDLTLLGDSQQLQLQGKVDLVDVRYVQKFDIIKQAFIKPRVHEEEVPFWQGSRLLEQLKLKLLVRSTGQMAVKNNYAELQLSGAFVVLGTLSEPRVDGGIRVEEGTFRIPFLRGEYTIRRGDISFSKRKKISDAELNITGETLFVDRTGSDYQIQIVLRGPLTRIGIKLTSTPPLEQGQIWALLATGRTTQQLKAQLKGVSDRAGNRAAGAADAQVKQLTGEILSQIIVDPLNKVTKLDLFRFELGTESAQIYGKKKLNRYISLAGKAELGLLGDNRVEGRLEFKMHDLLMLVGKLERLNTRLETEDIDPNRGRIELKLRLPLR